MSAVIPFPPSPAANVADLRMVQRIGSKFGVELSMAEAQEILRESRQLELSDVGREVARDIAGKLRIATRKAVENPHVPRVAERFGVSAEAVSAELRLEDPDDASRACAEMWGVSEPVAREKLAALRAGIRAAILAD